MGASAARAQKPAKDAGESRSSGTSATSVGSVGGGAGGSMLTPAARIAQLKLVVGRAGDRYEREADAVASRVTSGPAGAQPIISRVTPGSLAPLQAEAAEDRDEERGEVQRADRTGRDPTPSSSGPRDAETAIREGGRGRPLDPATRGTLEARMGVDLSGVRVHTGPRAEAASAGLRARAFTRGSDIWLGRGESPTDLGLLAHEATHVVQQGAGVRRKPAESEHKDEEEEPVQGGFWGNIYDSVADTLGDIAEWAVDKVVEFGWRLLEQISPEFARTVHEIVDEGILNWLGRQVARAWDGVIAGLRILIPFEGAQELIGVFAGLVERAASIVVALLSGDCEPLMDAISDLKDFVTEVLGVAWDKLTELLEPVGTFFRDLWNDFGAPAVEWLQEFGGAVWDGIQELGRRFWAWIRPVREAAERIWNWFKELLFGPDEGGDSGSEGGVIGWITRKAGEAWDWVKEQTRPVWSPVVQLAELVAEYIPPAFIREIGEAAQDLSAELNTVSEGMDGGDGVPEGRDTLASVLPSIEQIISTIRSVIVGAGALLSNAIGFIAGAVTGLIERLNGNSWLSWLGGALGWLADLVNSVLTWSQVQVEGLFNWLVQGFDALTPFIRLLLQAVRKVITIYADLAQLPLLVLSSIWQLVPACIREPIETFIKEQILSRIPVFGQFFSNPDLWPRVRDTALSILRTLFVEGDLARAAWMFFQAVLSIFGVPAQLVVEILAKAAQALGDILTDPIGFLVNTLRAMKAGFLRFFEYFGTHLLNGIAGWLFGVVREAGVQPPSDFSLRSILDFVLEVFGITEENIFARLALRVGRGVVDRLRRALEFATGVWSFISALVTEGPAGLWRELTERLSNLWDQVVEGVIGYVTEQLIGWATRWIIALLDVSGIMPVVNALIAIYHAIESFMRYLRQMLEIVSRVLDGILGIARGAIDEAAGYLEGALASSLPVAIGFLANQAGLGNLSTRLREILDSVRGRVDAAIDWLIDRALRVGRAILDMVRRGVATVRAGAAAVREWWRRRVRFRGADGRDHQLYFRGSGTGAELTIESRPQPFLTWLRSAPDGDDKTNALAMYEELRRTQRASPPGTGDAAASSGGETQEQRIVRLTHELSNVAARLVTEDTDVPEATSPEYGSLRDGFGTSVVVRRLTRRIPPGDQPGVEGGLWDVLAQRRRGRGSYYIRGHLLNHHLGGPGHTWANLTPLTRSANTSMSSSFEESVKTAVVTNSKTVRFEVTAVSGSSPDRSAEIQALRNPEQPNDEDRILADVLEAERAVPERVTGSAQEFGPNDDVEGGTATGPMVATLNQANTIERSLADYSVTDSARVRVSLSDPSQIAAIRSLPGIDEQIAARIIAKHTEGFVFRTQSQFLEATGAPAGIFDGFRSSSRFTVRLYSRT